MKETTIYTKLRDRIVDSVAIKLDLVSASGIKSDMFTNWTILFAFCCLLGGLAGLYQLYY